jgi:hypothetical protein
MTTQGAPVTMINELGDNRKQETLMTWLLMATAPGGIAHYRRALIPTASGGIANYRRTLVPTAAVGIAH